MEAGVAGVFLAGLTIVAAARPVLFAGFCALETAAAVFFTAGFVADLAVGLLPGLRACTKDFTSFPAADFRADLFAGARFEPAAALPVVLVTAFFFVVFVTVVFMIPLSSRICP
ncbi:MAG TPA: hypothetical protein VL051_05155 [Burkholderiaceae bacterium]|nr:hypothetical protein [Burkholderiaceae bacterium]